MIRVRILKIVVERIIGSRNTTLKLHDMFFPLDGYSVINRRSIDDTCDGQLLFEALAYL